MWWQRDCVFHPRNPKDARNKKIDVNDVMAYKYSTATFIYLFDPTLYPYSTAESKVDDEDLIKKYKKNSG